MKKIWHSFIVIMFGLFSSIATVIFIVFFQKFIKISLHTFSIWVILPVGAIASGFMASYGLHCFCIF